MKYLYLSLFVFSVIFISCSGKTENTEKEETEAIVEEIEIIKENDLEKNDLVGDIISINEIIYYADKTATDSLGEQYNRTYTKYNDKGYNTITEFYTSLDDMIRRSINIMEDDIVTKVEMYDGGDQLLNTDVYTYDENELLSEVASVSPDGTIYYTTYYTTDAKGRVSEMSSVSSYDNQEQVHSTYKYNEQGKRSESVFEDISGRYNRKYYYSYDVDGNLVSTSVYDDSDRLIQELAYVYSFDENGNWIKRIESNQGRLTYITVREIEYR